MVGALSKIRVVLAGAGTHNSNQQHSDEWGVVRIPTENNLLVGLSIDGPQEMHDAKALLGGREAPDVMEILAVVVARPEATQ